MLEIAERSAKEWLADCVQALADIHGEEMGGLVHELKSAIAARDAEIAAEAAKVVLALKSESASSSWNGALDDAADAIQARVRP